MKLKEELTTSQQLFFLGSVLTALATLTTTIAHICAACEKGELPNGTNINPTAGYRASEYFK